MYPPIEQFYDRATAAALVRGAAAAYGNDADMESWAKAQGCDGCEVVRNERTDTLAFVSANDDCGFVVFRGTRDLRNWITDLDCRRVKFELATRLSTIALTTVEPGLEVHAGIQGALSSVWDRMAGLIGRKAAGRRNLYFAGHSLGGGLAMLACARWSYYPGGASSFAKASTFAEASADKSEDRRPAGWMYSFGQPRVGNAAWMRWYDGMFRRRSFRIVHSADVVARVPWLLGMYRHCGTEVFYPAPVGRLSSIALAKEEVSVEPWIDFPWWRKAGNVAASLWHEWQLGPVALLGDHHVNTYLEVLNGI